MTVARAVLTGVLAALALVPGARADEIAQTQRATPVDADLAFAVWSAYDAQAGGFQLVLRSPGGAVRTLPTALSPVPFDADVGDDAQRRRVVVYSFCPSGPASCDVRVHQLRGDGDVPFAPAARPGVDEHAPTISRGRLAWATGGGSARRPRVWTGEIGSTRPPVELPALPRRRCETVLPGQRRCAAVHGTIDALELRGRQLAETAFATGVHEDSELRLVDLRSGSSAQILQFGNGESGPRLIGASIDGSHLYAYKTCFGDPSGCFRRAGTFRYAFDTGRLELAAARRQLSGFAVDRGRVLVSDGSEQRHCELEQGGYPGVPGLVTGPCPIEEQALPTTWRPYVSRR